MNLTKICAVGMSLLCGMAAAYAQDPISAALSVIIANNPQIESERELAKAQQLELADENSLTNPQVNFSRVWGTRGIGNKLQLDVSQSFDWPGVYRARSQAAKEGVSAAEMMLASVTLDVAMQAKEAMLQLVYVRKELELARKLQANLDKMKEALDQALGRGEATELDRRKIAIEEYKLDSEELTLISKEAQIMSDLQAMCPGVELDLSQITEYPIDCILSVNEYLAQVAELDPMVQSNMFTISQEELNARAARQSRFPSFSLGYQHQAEMGDRFNGFTAGVTLPFFEHRHARGAALARKGAAEKSVELLIAQKRAQIVVAMADMEKWHTQMDNYQRVFGDNAYLVLLQKAYAGGQINAIDFLSEVQYFYEATQAYLDADYNYRCALATLNKYSILGR